MYYYMVAAPPNIRGGPKILGGPMNPNDAMVVMLKDTVFFYVC